MYVAFSILGRMSDKYFSSSTSSSTYLAQSTLEARNFSIPQKQTKTKAVSNYEYIDLPEPPAPAQYDLLQSEEKPAETAVDKPNETVIEIPPETATEKPTEVVQEKTAENASETEEYSEMTDNPAYVDEFEDSDVERDVTQRETTQSRSDYSLADA